MNGLCVFGATLLLGGLPLAPALADDLDDLDVTMEVFDDPADIDEAVSEMRGPDDGAFGDVGHFDDAGPESADDVDGEASGAQAGSETGAESDFEHDEDFDESDLEDEDDFEREQGEDVDDDREDDGMDDDRDDDGGDDRGDDDRDDD